MTCTKSEFGRRHVAAASDSVLESELTLCFLAVTLTSSFLSCSIYVELSEQYRHMNSKSAKRRALASHLKESIDTLEVKADQVRRLHDMLHDE